MQDNPSNDPIFEEEHESVPTGLGEASVAEEIIKLGIEGDEANEFIPEEEITLPVGIAKEGQRYRKVVIEEMCGIDEHLISSKKAQGNGAVGMTMVICRCIQEVEGLLPKKQNTEAQFDRSLGRAMTQVDRDYIISRIQLLGGNNDVIMAGECPRCSRVWEETVLLSSLPVTSWPEDKPTYVEFELVRGVSYVDKESKEKKRAKKGKIRFPTGKDQEGAASLDTIVQQMDAMLAACIFDLEGIGTLDTETAKRLKSIDRRDLMETLRTELPGIRQWKEVKCTCGKNFIISVDLTSFFEGRRRSQKK